MARLSYKIQTKTGRFPTGQLIALSIGPTTRTVPRARLLCSRA